MLLPSYRDLLAAPDARGCASAATFVAREIKRVGAFWRAWRAYLTSFARLSDELVEYVLLHCSLFFVEVVGLIYFLLACQCALFF